MGPALSVGEKLPIFHLPPLSKHDLACVIFQVLGFEARRLSEVATSKHSRSKPCPFGVASTLEIL